VRFANKHVVFTATTSKHGTELWIADGTTAGLRRMAF